MYLDLSLGDGANGTHDSFIGSETHDHWDSGKETLLMALSRFLNAIIIEGFSSSLESRSLIESSLFFGNLFVYRNSGVGDSLSLSRG